MGVILLRAVCFMLWAHMSNGGGSLGSDETRRGFASRLDAANMLYLHNLKPQATSALREVGLALSSPPIYTL